jgi:putative tricarboxylic transport membrane protein
MRRAEVLANILWVGLGCALCLGSVKLGLGTPGDPQSGFLPFGTGILLIILGCIRCVRLCTERGIIHADPAIWTGATWRRPAIVVAALALYAVVLPHLGYLITTAAVMLTLFTLYGRRHMVLAVGGSLLISFLTYFVFHELLRVQLPSGLIGFRG